MKYNQSILDFYIQRGNNKDGGWGWGWGWGTL
jgi:hypothetical protein